MENLDLGMMKAKILVLFANKYDMLDEDKRPLTGCSVHYLFWGENGERLLEESQWDPNKPVGVQRAKCSLDQSVRTKIPMAPAIYEGTFKMTVGGDGKPVMRLQDVAFYSNVRMQEHIVNGLVIPGMVEHPAVPAGEAPKTDNKGSK